MEFPDDWRWDVDDDGDGLMAWTQGTLKSVDLVVERLRLYVILENDHGADPIYVEFFPQADGDEIWPEAQIQARLAALNGLGELAKVFSVGLSMKTL